MPVKFSLLDAVAAGRMALPVVPFAPEARGDPVVGEALHLLAQSGSGSATPERRKNSRIAMRPLMNSAQLGQSECSEEAAAHRSASRWFQASAAFWTFPVVVSRVEGCSGK